MLCVPLAGIFDWNSVIVLFGLGKYCLISRGSGFPAGFLGVGCVVVVRFVVAKLWKRVGRTKSCEPNTKSVLP